MAHPGIRYEERWNGWEPFVTCPLRKHLFLSKMVFRPCPFWIEPVQKRLDPAQPPKGHPRGIGQLALQSRDDQAESEDVDRALSRRIEIGTRATPVPCAGASAMPAALELKRLGISALIT